MGELKSKIEGNIKSGVGRATGDEDLEARGEGQKAVGKVQEGTRKVGGAIEEAVGRATGNVGDEAKGRARQA